MKKYHLIGIILDVRDNTKKYIQIASSSELDKFKQLPGWKYEHLSPLLEKFNNDSALEYARHPLFVGRYKNSPLYYKYAAIVFSENWKRAMHIW